ncbi:FtsX-like permease family protein [Natroniella acetigena]|nr:FtsX-like permease family protein [Natroniella acetigena]MCK8827742.1 FtsX-like permease family protein [Natroniella acetigena]
MLTAKDQVTDKVMALELGAKKKDILLQFLIESLSLSAIGGRVGIGLGYLATYFIS